MYVHPFVVCIWLLGTFLANSPAATAPQDQSESGKSETVSREVRRQAKELAQRFRRVNDVILREQLVDEAIQLGKPYAEEVLGVVDLESTKSLETYGDDFRKQIDKADRITAAGVVSSSTKLQQARKRLVQLETIETKLREFLKLKPRWGPGDAETIHEATPSFEETLRVEEEDTVERWLLTRGYRRLTSDENSVILAINQLRQEAGLGLLEVDYKLCFAARDHSRDMVRKHFFSHTSRVRGKKTFSDRAKRLGTVAHAENIALCNTAVSPVSLWLKSPRHKKIMFGKLYNTIGVGRVDNKYTAMFGRKAAVKPDSATQQSSNGIHGSGSSAVAPPQRIVSATVRLESDRGAMPSRAPCSDGTRRFKFGDYTKCYYGESCYEEFCFSNAPIARSKSVSVIMPTGLPLSTTGRQWIFDLSNSSTAVCVAAEEGIVFTDWDMISITVDGPK